MKAVQIGDCILYQGDCLVVMPTLDKVDMVLADPPYGSTQNKWDSVIPLDAMWSRLKDLTNDNTPIIMTAQTPFDKMLGYSNIRDLKYEWIWQKEQGTGFFHSKKMPLKDHENILVFYRKLPTYNPQMRKGKPYACKKGHQGSNYGDRDGGVPTVTVSNGERYPLTCIKFNRDGKKAHPTQKPVALMEYLIKTYTNEGDVVLDFTMGSGTTGVACVNTGRKFIGIELDAGYFDIACDRISTAVGQSIDPSNTDTMAFCIQSSN